MGIGKVYEGARRLAGIEVVMWTKLTMGGGRSMTLGLDADRRVIGEWCPPGMPASWSPVNLAKRLNGGLSRLLLAAAGRPRLLLAGWRLELPPVSTAARGGPLRRSRSSARASSSNPPMPS